MRVFFFFLFVNDRTPFTDSSVAGHNILHRLTSTVSYESQTLRQEVTTLSPLINKHYERQLLSINQSYINYFLQQKPIIMIYFGMVGHQTDTAEPQM